MVPGCAESADLIHSAYPELFGCPAQKFHKRWEHHRPSTKLCARRLCQLDADDMDARFSQMVAAARDFSDQAANESRS